MTKRRLLRTTVLAGFAAASLMAAPGFAQEAEDEEAVPVATTQDRIVITGSRIARPDYTASNPVVSVDAQNIAYSGVTNLTDFLSDLPALINSFDSQTSANTGNSGAAGLNLLNLRGLGTNRTLILVDGRRHVAGNPGSAAVDVNTIPMGLIERVEVMTGGASAVYGADGVSGVVNFVMRDTFEGTSVRAQYGGSEAGGGERTFASVLHGRNFLNNRLNLTIGLEYAHEGEVNSSQRHYTAPGQREIFVNNPFYAGPGPGQFRRMLSNDARYIDTAREGTVYTDFWFSPTLSGASHRGDGIPWQDGLYTGEGFVMIGGHGTLLDDFIDQVLPGQDRYVFNATARYEINANHAFFGELKYVNTQTMFQAQPTFDYFFPVRGDVAYMPDSIRNAIDPFWGQLFYPGDPVANTDGVAFVGRDNFDLGHTGTDIDRETWRVVAGFEGQIPVLGGLDYELSFVYGTTEQNTVYLNDRIEERWLAAIDAIHHPVTNEIVCRSDVFPNMAPLEGDWFKAGTWQPHMFGATFTPGPGSGCVPANIWGENISPAAAAWINQDSHYRDTITQQVFSGHVTGDLDSFFTLPAGSVLFAAGVEHRTERSRSYASELELLSHNLGFDVAWSGNRQNTGGSFNVREAFVEVEVPLIRDVPVFQEVTADAAYRWSDYSTSGGTESWKLGGRWRLNDSFMFRATTAQAVRAPNITELFSPQVQTFQFISDPCTAVNVNAGSALRYQNCLEILGSDPNSFVDPTSFTRQGLTGGNPDLRPEVASTVTYGLVFTPSTLPNFSLSLDFYDITLEDAVLAVTGQTIADKCVDLPRPNQFCDMVQRDMNPISPTFQRIVFFEAFMVNVGEYRTSGLDFTARYLFDPANFGFDRDVGQFQFTMAGNRLYSLTFQELPDALPDERRSYPNAPTWTMVFDATWLYHNWSVNYGYSWHTETRRFTRERMAANPDWVAPEYVFFPERAVHDVQVRYEFDDRFSIYGGVNNFTDQEPAVGSQITPVGALGRFFYFGAVANF